MRPRGRTREELEADGLVRFFLGTWYLTDEGIKLATIIDVMTS